MHKCPHQEKRTLRLVKWKTQVPTGTSQTPPWGRQPPTQALLDHYFRETETDDVNSSFIKMLLHPDFYWGKGGKLLGDPGESKRERRNLAKQLQPTRSKERHSQSSQPQCPVPGETQGQEGPAWVPLTHPMARYLSSAPWTEKSSDTRQETVTSGE